MGVFLGERHRFPGFCRRSLLRRQIVALHIPGRDAVVAQHQHRRCGIVDAVARAAALQHIVQEIVAAQRRIHRFVIAQMVGKIGPDGRLDLAQRPAAGVGAQLPAQYLPDLVRQLQIRFRHVRRIGPLQ